MQKNTARVDQSKFVDEHYLGQPADDTDLIITRRITVLESYPDFFSNQPSLLEIGCGSGATITKVAPRFSRCLGIDIFDYAVSFAAQKQKNNAAGCEFRQLNLEQEKLNESFDRIISFEVIEHLLDEHKSIDTFHSLLKPGGMMAISVPNKWWIFETHGAKLPLLPWNRVPFFSWLPRPIHERFANARIYTKNRILNLLTRHQFEIIDWQYITAPMDVLKEGSLKRFVKKYIFKHDTTKSPFLSTSIFVIAKRK